MKDEYISITEFAKRAGVSRQAVYKRLSTDLSTEFTEVDNQKMIKVSALRLFAVNQVVNETVNQVDSNSNENEPLLRTISMLEKELSIKNQQIESQNRQLEDYSNRLKESHLLIDQQQKLQAISEKSRIEAQKQPEPQQENLLNREKFSTEAEYVKFLRKLLPNINMFSGKKDFQEQEYILELMSEEERQLLQKKGIVKNLDYLLDPSIKKGI